MFLCAVSQSTYFAVSYSGRLNFMFYDVQLSEECAKYGRKIALIYTCLAWALVLMNLTFMLYSTFFAGGYMDIMLAPVTIHTNVSDILGLRVVVYLASIHQTSAWVFPHAMSFMLATIFTHQYKALGRRFETVLAESDERRVSDSDIEMFRQKHQEISMHLDQADDCLMFHNAAAFCCQLFCVILLLYDFIFFRSTADHLVIIMRVLWLFSTLCGLSLTAAGGIMVNYYVRIQI